MLTYADVCCRMQARRTALWEERQHEEALALSRLSDEQRRRAERKRKPRTGPPQALFYFSIYVL